MIKALSEPKHLSTFRDNYLAVKKGAAALMFFFICACSFAQNIHNKIADVATMAALYAYPATSLSNGQIVDLSGFYAANDGGGGQFVWNSSSTATCDSGTIIKATSITTGRFIRQYAAGAVNASWFGVIPDGVKVLTSALQNAINKTGHVIVNRFSSNIILNNSLSIPSNTWLDIDPATTLYLQDSSYTCMLHNATIDSTGITDHDITITGGIWDDNWLGNPGTFSVTPAVPLPKYSRAIPSTRGLNYGNFQFDGVKNVTVRHMIIKNPLESAIHINHFSNIEVGNIILFRDQQTISDGVHLSGPGDNFYIHDISGKTGDDCVAIGAWEWWIASAGSQHGDIKNGRIERINMDSTVWNLVKMYGGTNAWLRNISINDVSGISYNSAFYWGTDPDGVFAANVPGVGTLDHITMTNVSAASLNSITVAGFGVFGSVLQIKMNATDIVIDKIRMDSIYAPNFSAHQPWLKADTGTIKSLSILNFNQNTTLPWSEYFDLLSTVGTFNFQGNIKGTSVFTGNLGLPAISLGTASHISNVNISNSTANGHYGWVYQQSGADSTTINVANTYTSDWNAAFQSAAKAKLSLTNNQFRKNNSVVVYAINSAANWAVISQGNQTDAVGVGTTLYNGNSGHVRWIGTDLTVDQTVINSAISGDIVSNNAATSGSVGLNMWNGTAWIAFNGSWQSGSHVNVSGTGTYSALGTDCTIEFTGTTATLAYPTANLINGRQLYIVNYGSGSVTIPSTKSGNVSTITALTTNQRALVEYDLANTTWIVKSIN